MESPEEELHITNEHDTEPDVSTEDITVALSKKLGSAHFVILYHKLQKVPEKLGLLGEHSFLRVTYLNVEGLEETAAFFVKFYPKMPSQQQFADGTGAFKKEMLMYRILEEFTNANISLASSVTSKCYLAKYNEYMILDDLVDEGYEPFDKHTTLDYDTVLVILQALARFHASSIIYEKQQGKTLMQQYPEEIEESFFDDKDDFISSKWVDPSINCILKEIEVFEFPSTLRSGRNFSKFAQQICYKICDLGKPSRKFRNVLCHGDLWMTNILVKRDGKTNKVVGCKFVDFQCGRYVPPAQDVLCLLHLTTSREFRKSYLYEVIGMYYSYLEKHLKTAAINLEQVLPFFEFMNSCEEQKLFAIVITAIYFPLILINNDIVDQYLSEAIFHDRTHLFLSNMDKDESYKKRLKDSIEDLKDYCEYL